MHATLPGTGLLALPLAAAAAVVVLAAGRAPDRGRPGGGDLVEMEVVGVVPMEEESSLVGLSQKDAEKLLPLVIGRAEAMAIDMRLHDARAPRPLTHDLLGQAIDALGAKVTRVEIDGLQDAVFVAKIRLAQGDKRLVLDARPSDSIALALGAHAPIFASRKVLEGAGLDKSDLDRMRKRGGPRQEPGRGGGRTETL